MTICLFTVIGSLSVINFVHGEEYSKKAYARQVRNQIISPKRGTIYDANGEVLAQSIAVDTVSLNPGKVRYANNEKVEDKIVAEGLSEIFNITYEDLIQKLGSNSSVIVIEKKVSSEKITELKNWMSENKITTGINIDEDSKRFYPHNNLASNLLGFCTVDNTGITGLEERWDSTLTGTAGKVVTARDVDGNPISDNNEQYVAAENGNNLYLTIDMKVQAIAEKYLKQAITENNCSRGGNVLIMNPQTGDILAMATYPDFNLNDPYSLEALGFTEEDWATVPSEEKNTKYINLWANRAVSGYYEPGSTYKLITASVALEEHLIETDTPGQFFCSGSYHVADRDISCWRKEPHGTQSLRDALCNSCNPAFMQLGQRIGANTLYRYFKAFGLFEGVGSDIAKAYPGSYHPLESIGAVELATTSFGQRFDISPLQLITSVCAIVNDGKLVTPKIIKQKENIDTKSIETVETKEVRQVISEDTSKKIKNMMQSVVTDGTGKLAAVKGHSIGGKSGTSEPPIGRETDGYTASFIAISPIENTQVVVLVVLYDPNGVSFQGGQTAGPVASQILSEVLPYLGITSGQKESGEGVSNLIYLSNLKGKTVAESKQLLQQLGFNVKLNTEVDENTITVADQTPKSGVALEKGSIIYLYTQENEPKNLVMVPNIKGMSVSDAKRLLRQSNLNIEVEGTEGVVVSQAPTFDTQIEEGSVIKVVIKEELTDGQ